MAQESVARGDRLFVEEEYAGAAEAYSEALQADPSNARVLEARANAYIKLEQYSEANADATKALELSPGLAKAYLRKGIALFNMEEYEAAKEFFEAGCQLAPDNTFRTWTRKCDAELEARARELEQKGELDGGDPLNNFFKKIFSQGDEDTQRAMMKSFVESNGTVLSTNWNEVGKKKVDCTPPEGMEVHKYEA
ncbi:Protein SGT1 B [Tetrabaena socialis]|uniref:Protein SGT1 B n=1 Tax=Tetrabaena socialis TaxID=47790 RepID=A0A2J7ZY61_9CHLO|nr:Protein SGT1 B [Tetrabaena socialis]|eukprot:PNH05200.1 Protein SGT1 B [Tetrabaena socialis]